MRYVTANAASKGHKELTPTVVNLGGRVFKLPRVSSKPVLGWVQAFVRDWKIKYIIVPYQFKRLLEQQYEMRFKPLPDNPVSHFFMEWGQRLWVMTYVRENGLANAFESGSADDV